MGRCIVYTGIRLFLLIHPYFSSFFFLSNFQALIFLSHLSQELWGLEDWNLLHTWTVGRCIVYTRIRLLLLIRPFMSSFFFISNVQTLKFFVTLFSGTASPRRLKLGTHMDSGQIYGVPESGCFCFFIPLFLHFSSFSPIFKHWNILSHFSQELWGLEDWNLVQTWTVGRLIVYTGIRCCCLFTPLFISFLSLQFSNIKIFHHTFLSNCEA